MKARVIGISVKIPRRKNKQVTCSTGIETTLRRFPVFTDWLFLQKNQGETGVKGIADYKALTF